MSARRSWSGWACEDAHALGPEVHQRTEGWVAGAHLMALAYRQGRERDGRYDA